MHQKISGKKNNERKFRSLSISNYLEKILNELWRELSSFLNSSEIDLIRKLYKLIEQNYKKLNMIGRGYHCLEHSLELVVLILKSWKHGNGSLPSLSKTELLEMVVAGLLHDYDPYKKEGAPQVSRTTNTLRKDLVLKKIMTELKLDPFKIILLIERTDYPFTTQKEVLWRNKLTLHFSKRSMREKIVDRATKLALFDKSATYFSLTPHQARKRVEALAKELNYPAERVLAGTYEFLKRENIKKVSEWVPKEFRKQWTSVRRYFKTTSRSAPDIIVEG